MSKMTWIPDETPILESVFVDFVPNAGSIREIVVWENDDAYAAWVWWSLSYAELADLSSELSRANNPFAARIWCRP